MRKKISVIIPTYNRPHLLANCLKALSNQTLPIKNYEIIVVSDGPDKATEKVIDQFRADELAEIYYYALSSKKGPAAARNIGWRNANAVLVAFTDDDCIPDTNWLKAVCEKHNDEELVAYTGKVVVPVSERPTDFEMNTAGLETAEFVTANCIVTKQALIKTGGFDEAFKTAWREDSDLHFKLMLNRISIYKNTKAVVVHPVRRAAWGISLKEQKKSMYNALLYKKYPQLFRARIKPRPNWIFYVAAFSFVVAIIASAVLEFTAASIGLGIWLTVALWFTFKRLFRTSKAINHIAEMFVTSLFIPILSVYWTLYGAWKYRVMFL